MVISFSLTAQRTVRYLSRALLQPLHTLLTRNWPVDIKTRALNAPKTNTIVAQATAPSEPLATHDMLGDLTPEELVRTLREENLELKETVSRLKTKMRYERRDRRWTAAMIDSLHRSMSECPSRDVHRFRWPEETLPEPLSMDEYSSGPEQDIGSQPLEGDDY